MPHPLLAGLALAQLAAAPAVVPPDAPTAAPGPDQAVVRFDGRDVLRLGESPNLTSRERAALILARLEAHVLDPELPAIAVEERTGVAVVTAAGEPLVSVTTQDVAVNGAASPAALAATWRERLADTLVQAREERRPDYMLRAIGLTVLVSFAAAVLGRVVRLAYKRVRDTIAADGSRLVELSFGWMRHVPYLAKVDPRPALATVNYWLAALAFFAIANGWLIVVLGFFPQTRAFNDLLLRSLASSFASLGAAIVGFLPNLVTIAVTVFVTVYAVRLIAFVFRQMMENPQELGFGLPRELLSALEKVAHAVAWVFAAMAIAPLLPGLGTQTGQVIGLLVGAMITLGSGSTIGNAVAGFLLIYMRPFEVGDRVRIGDIEGDVLERNFTSVRLRTIYNEVVTLTGNQVLSSTIVNYSTPLSREAGLILRAAVTVGYDVPRARTEALLLDAAGRAADVLAEPAPRVLVTGLGDFSIAYELHVATGAPHRKLGTLAALHGHILDAFNEAGVEILSPIYQANRDGSAPALPGQAAEPS